MILYPPIVFNGNEWFILIASLLSWGIILSLPKRFNLVIVAMIWLFNYFLAEIVDFTIAVPPVDLYDFNDWPQYEIFDIILYFFMYPPAAYLMVYFYDKWKLSGWWLAVYILAGALVTVGLEWSASQFHVFTYKGWKLVYSIPAYILIYILNIIVFRFVGKRLNTGAR